MATIGEWRTRLRQDLHSVSGVFAPTDADAILGEILGASPTQLTLRSADSLTSEQESRLQILIQKRISGVPLAYVLGHVEFYGLDLLCDERVLIPRPETEAVVTAALSTLAAPTTGYRPLVIDIGTGSGNIALALAHERPDVHVIATDLSTNALEIAKANRERYNLTDRVRLVLAKSLTVFPHGLNADLIVSNPPYVPDYDTEVQQSVHDFEPHVALYAGSDGTEILSELIDNARHVLSPNRALVCEIGYNQTGQIREIVRQYPGWSAPIFHRSIAGFDRVLELRLLTSGLS
jgi:release factor glutamine methyltransferase